MFLYENMITHLLNLLLCALIDGQILRKASETTIQVSG